MDESAPNIEQPKITYEELKAIVRKAQSEGKEIKNMANYYSFMREVYANSFEKDPNNPIELPAHPEKDLADWVSVEDFLGPQEVEKEKEQITYEELKSMVRKAQSEGKEIKNMANYYSFMREVYANSSEKDPNNPIELPAHPEKDLADWVSVEDFLGINEIVVDERLPY